MACTECIFAQIITNVHNDFEQKMMCLKGHLDFDDIPEVEWREVDAQHVDCIDLVEGTPVQFDIYDMRDYLNNPLRVVPDARQREALVSYNISWRFHEKLETEESRATLMEQYIDQEVPEAYVKEMTRVYGSFQGAMANATPKGRAVLFAWWGRTQGGVVDTPRGR